MYPWLETPTKENWVGLETILEKLAQVSVIYWFAEWRAQTVYDLDAKAGLNDLDKAQIAAYGSLCQGILVDALVIPPLFTNYN